MAPKICQTPPISSHMTLNFRQRRRTTSECTHRNSMRIEIAGMSREVCENCGNVSVGYVDDHFSRDGAAQVVEAAAEPESSED